MPYRCQSRNQGLCASISSCLRFAAERSAGLSGLASGTAKMRSSHSISAMVCSVSMCLNHLVRNAIDQTEAGLVFPERFVHCQSMRQRPQLTPAALANGKEYHMDMSRIRPQCLDTRSDVLLREEPDEEEDNEEDEGNVTDDEGDDDEEDDGGYSVRVCRLCQW
jgi:hypothetical protein